MRHFVRSMVVCCVGLALVAACGDDDGTRTQACEPGTQVGCGAGLICEPVQGGTAACFAPVSILGRVFDLRTGTGIAAATVVALDANGGARSGVARSAADGTYELPVSVLRTSDGHLVMDAVTLRVAAAGYQPFPRPPRAAVPIELSEASATAAPAGRVVMNAATDVGLLALPGDTSALSTIDGTVDATEPGGVLVVAEQGGRAVSSAVTDASGDFTLFNVPPGSTHLTGYRSGLSVVPMDVNATAAGLAGVVLQGSTAGLATVGGSVNIVNAPGGASTSVILVVESTFEEAAKRGESPAGLRAGGVTNAFSIADVPPGRYVVLAAFENDGLVRDPDTEIGGTAIVHIEVPASGGNVSLPESFKVTGALAVVSPGADAIEVIHTSAPTFVWQDDSSEDGYEIRVYDAFGTVVHENTMVPRVTGSTSVSYTWTGAALEAGMIYQFRAYSFRDQHGKTYISSTEDLRGVFTYEP